MSDTQCYLCKVSDPAFLCLCEEVNVCRNCISQHLLSNPSPMHKPLPLDRRELIQAVREEISGSHQASRSELSEKYLDRCNILKQVLKKEISRIQAFKISSEVKLQQAKHAWETQIAKTISELMETLSEQTEKAVEELYKKLGEVENNAEAVEKMWGDGITEEDEFVEISTEVKPLDLSSQLRSSIVLFIHPKDECSDSPVLYKFFGGMNQVGIFEVKSERYTKTLQSSAKFYHNSCSCVSPSGMIYLTGGSLTGRSRSDAASFHPKTRVVAALQPMQTARRSHASICLDNNCYVFGGLIEDDRSSLCEKYVVESGQWVSLSHMNERRAYLGCCEFRGKVYIGGGSTTPSCEIYLPETATFELLKLAEVNIEDNCSLVALTDSLLIFHGNFQGEVSRFWPESGKVEREREICYGNSWSSCAPVLYNNSVYMLRSESIFKYEIETGESSYVLRMGKTAQRRLHFE